MHRFDTESGQAHMQKAIEDMYVRFHASQQATLGRARQ